MEEAFVNFTSTRKDIAIVLINQHVCGPAAPCMIQSSYTDYRLLSQIAEKIRHRMDTFTEAFPAVLEIPSKDHPYDPEKDSVLRRVRRLFGE